MTRSRSPVLLLAALLLGSIALAVATAPPAPARSCAQSSFAEKVRRSGAVFDGVVEDVRGSTTDVRVTAVYKGEVPSSVRLSEGHVQSANDYSPFQLDEGERWLFYVSGQPDSYVLGDCGGTAPYSTGRAARLRDIAGDPRAPEPGSAIPESHWGVYWGVGGGAVLAAVAAWLVVRRWRSRRSGERGTGSPATNVVRH